MTTQKTVNLSQYYVKKTDLATPGTDGTSANGATDGLMSGADKYKLNGISPSSTTPSADTTNGSYGSGTDYARANHQHPKSSLYAEASHSHGNIKNDGTFNGVHVVDTYNMNVVTDSHGVISLEDKYTHPNDLGSTKTSGLYKIALNDKGHVTSATSVEKSDITGLGIPASDTTYSLADGTTNGLSSNDFTSAEKTKLNGIATGANNYTHPASHGNITSEGKCSTTGTVDVSRGDLLLFADATSNQYTIKGSTFIDALNDLILDLIDEGES